MLRPALLRFAVVALVILILLFPLQTGTRAQESPAATELPADVPTEPPATDEPISSTEPVPPTEPAPAETPTIPGVWSATEPAAPAVTEPPTVAPTIEVATAPPTSTAEPTLVSSSPSSQPTVRAAALTDTTFIALVLAGPQRAPGACWRYAINEGGEPGDTVAGPVCDEDGDGEVLLADLPSGAYCYVVTPPPGYYRPEADYHQCAGDLGGLATVTVGFAPIPTPSPTPTRTPTRTPTPTPTPSPAPSEPNGNIATQNCVSTNVSDGAIFYSGCQPVGGITLAVLQNGVEIARVTTGGDGAAAVALPERTAYQLHVVSGTSEPWVPGVLEETKPRYGQTSTFTFEPSPATDRTWTMVVNTVAGDFGESGPVGGACYDIVDYATKAELLPPACDGDGDGTVVVGTLPPNPINSYVAVMTTIPAGYQEVGTVFGNEPTGLDYVWTGTAQIRRAHPNFVVTTIDNVTEQLLPGFCYYARLPNAGGILTFSFCDDDDGAADGVTIVQGPLEFGATYEVVTSSYIPRYFTTVSFKTVSTAANGDTAVTFRAYRYGTDASDKADLLLTALVEQNGETRSGGHAFCFNLFRTPPGYSAFNFCGGGDSGQLLFEDLPAGSYDLELEANHYDRNCTAGELPHIEVGAGDLGTTLERTIVFRCPDSEQTAICTVTRGVSRHVDVYYGRLTDPESGNELVGTFELSESIYGGLAFWFSGAINPDPSLFTLGSLWPWVDQSSDFWWDQEDWNGDARARLLADYQALGSTFALEAATVTQQHSETWLSIATFSDQPQDFPECATGGPYEFVEITTNYSFDVTIVEQNAVVTNGQSGGATATATATPSPTPLACVEPVVREVTLYTGRVTDAEDATIATGLELSDHIPAGLAAALAQTGTVAGELDPWVQPGIADSAWVTGDPEGRDAEGNLIAGYATSGEATPGEPVDHGTIEVELGTINTYLDQAELPEGCVVVAWGPLYAVEQRAVARVHVIELNATLGAGPNPTGTGQPTATPTLAPGDSPTPAATAASVTRLPQTGAGAAGHGGWNAPSLAILATTLLILCAGWRGRRPCRDGIARP